MSLRRPRLIKAFMAHKVLAGVEHSAVLTRSLKTVVDVGANCGQFALATRELANSFVFSFEPLEEPAKVFRALFSDDPKVKFFCYAIGPVDETKTMHVSAKHDSSSMLTISEMQTAIFPGTHEVSTTEVRTAPLDLFLTADDLSSPALLKIDVQGFEYEVLLGCQSLLHCFNFIYCECSFLELYSGQKLVHEVISWLAEFGFILCGVYNATFDRNGRSVQADFLFERLNNNNRI